MIVTLDEWEKKVKQRILAVRQGSCLAISALVVTRTPVNKGALRSSWTPSIGKDVKADNIDLTETSKRHDIEAVCRRLKEKDVYTLGNGQPYARRIEYEGHSSQAPNGMLRRSAAEWRRIVEAEARKAKSGS